MRIFWRVRVIERYCCSCSSMHLYLYIESEDNHLNQCNTFVKNKRNMLRGVLTGTQQCILIALLHLWILTTPIVFIVICPPNKSKLFSDKYISFGGTDLSFDNLFSVHYMCRNWGFSMQKVTHTHTCSYCVVVIFRVNDKNIREHVLC